MGVDQLEGDAMALNITVKTQINFNGRQYKSVNDMPPDVRSVYEQAVAGAASRGIVNIATTVTKTKLKVNGQEYNSPDDMPADVRQIYDRVMGEIDKNGNGVPDVLEGGAPAAPAAAPPRLKMPPPPASFSQRPESFSPTPGQAAPEASAKAKLVRTLVVVGVLVAMLAYLLMKR